LKATLPADLPVLLIAPNGTPFCAPKFVEASKAFVPSLEVVRLEASHFVMLEKKEAVTDLMVNWLGQNTSQVLV
jgi:pimeloyl-ACP methyl ester carboxylesterase